MDEPSSKGGGCCNDADTSAGSDDGDVSSAFTSSVSFGVVVVLGGLWSADVDVSGSIGEDDNDEESFPEADPFSVSCFCSSTAVAGTSDVSAVAVAVAVVVPPPASFSSGCF